VIFYGALFVFGAVVQVGILLSRGAATSGTNDPAATPTPGSGSVPDLTIIAYGIAYDAQMINVDSAKPFRILFKNEDLSTTLHDIDIRLSDGKTVVRNQDTITGAQEILNVYEALEAGTYQFICSIHPTSMVGILLVH
jgi:hypothetical protein